jgi:hypothetical protein
LVLPHASSTFLGPQAARELGIVAAHLPPEALKAKTRLGPAEALGFEANARLPEGVSVMFAMSVRLFLIAVVVFTIAAVAFLIATGA